MRKHLEKIPYLIFSLFIFITMPIAYYILSNQSEVLISLLIIIFPLTTFIISFMFAYLKEEFSYSFGIITGLFYILSCIILLNFDILVYSLLYIFANLCGQGTGFVIKKIKRRIPKKTKKDSQVQ